MAEEEEESKDEDEARRKRLIVEDYTEEEIEKDMNAVDWDFAYTHDILKMEAMRQDKKDQET